ncbi:MAG TPA: CRISPR-associated helicase Cas3' [Desulfobulbaceae bacterium]|nr:CRISPR-associated helicase Cas3' [Desulfobulbaceae bacterium]
MAGLLHDVGKYSRTFQKYLRASADEAHHVAERHRKVDHSTAGAQYVAKHLGAKGRLLAYCIAGHHAGLADGTANDRKCLEARLGNKNIPPWREYCPKKILACKEPGPFPFARNQSRAGFQISFFTRLLYSCLVDADFLDTERFIDPKRARFRQGYPTLDVLWRRLAEYIRRFEADSEINRLRADILSACISAGTERPGFFSLTVPTGGGKTISSLAFALKHALTYGLDRVIYVIPYTSIIEQNAAVFRDICGMDAVVEHHANFDPEKIEEIDETNAYRLQLASENWDAPLIVTTNVQFFESLFASRSSRCRKLHNIAKSVVILDEAQMLPVPLLRPCLESLRELVDTYKTSVVLCTATQPALDFSEKFPQGLKNVYEIAPRPQLLYEKFRRFQFAMLPKGDDESIAAEIQRRDQVLCIVNTRRHARELYELLRHEGDDYFHLSALMCPAHRSQRITEIKERLADKKKCRVVSTQLIEAGVDIDFPVVLRAVAGIDSLVQAAGRCNREGKLPYPGEFFVFMPEWCLPPGHFRQCADAAQTVFRHHGDDPFSLDAVEEYFRTFYWQQGNERLDAKGILTDLEEDMGRLNFPFRQVSQKFEVIPDGQESIIIPWDKKAEGLVEALRYAEHPGGLMRRLQPYVVQVPPKALSSLVTVGSVEKVRDRFNVLINMDLYRDDLGLCPEDPTFHEIENLMV